MEYAALHGSGFQLVGSASGSHAFASGRRVLQLEGPFSCASGRRR
jgi:hypothetical protein